MNFKEKVVYQIYPKSFYDSNGDGVGDLQGIIQKIPYLADLGVDVLWFNPFFKSPQHDNGYDISDYCAIDPLYGTMSDFEQLVSEMTKYKMEIMLDMVLNHTSTDHPWFQKALAGEEKYQNYYILRPAKKDGGIPTNWDSKFGGKAWNRFGQTNNYYLHLFDKTQADLNWRNPEVREEMQKIVQFWLDKGVRGFRFDVINLIGKDEELHQATDDVGKYLYTDRPIVHEFLHQLNQATFGKYPTMTVGEMSATTIENCILYTQPDRQELDMTFNFHHLKVDYDNGNKWSKAPVRFNELTTLLHDWGEGMSEAEGWNALFWNNHDQPRALTRFADDQKLRVPSAKMLATAIHLNRGTPFIYQGEEIGMTDPYFESIDEYRDVESLNAYDKLREEGLSNTNTLEIIQTKSRDNSRTPIPWNNQVNAGFSTGTPWLGLGKNWQTVNINNELTNGSIYSYYQKLIQLRKTYSVISRGDYQAFDRDNTSCYSYIREDSSAKLLVITNFTSNRIAYDLPEEWQTAEVLINNYDTEVTLTDSHSRAVPLQAYQALALLIKK